MTECLKAHLPNSRYPDIVACVHICIFVDDVTVIEVIDSILSSQMQTLISQNHLSHLKQQLRQLMTVPLSEFHPSSCSGSAAHYQMTFVGAVIREISAKANKRLRFLKLLKRSAMTADDLLHCYKTIKRRVIENACPVWQSSLTVDELRRLETSKE